MQSLLDRKDDTKNQIRVCEMLGECPDGCFSSEEKFDNSKKEFLLKAVFIVQFFEHIGILPFINNK